MIKRKSFKVCKTHIFKQLKKIKHLSKTQNPINIKNENTLLKNEVNSLKNDLTLFIESTETFQKIIGSQVGMINHTGIGFDASKHQKIYKNFFIPQKDKLKCSFCDKNGRSESLCFHKKRMIKEHSLQHKERTFIKKCAFCKRSGHFDVDCFLKIKNLELLKTNKKGPTNSGVPKKPLTQNVGILSKCKEKAMVLGQWLF